MTLFALCNGARTPSLMCYDHMGRGIGGSSTLLMCVWIGQWLVQMGLAAVFWCSSIGGSILESWSITALGPPSQERGTAILAMLGCVTAHYAWVFVYRGLGSKITMGLDTSFMVVFLVCCIQGGACLLAWCLPIAPPMFTTAIILFLVGLCIEVISDEQLHAFVSRKAEPGYSGPRVMATGLRGVSRHPNLIGFVLYWCGFALISGAWYFCLGVGLVFAIFIIVQVIPAHEYYMATKYGEEWNRYVAHTPVWVPHPFCRKTDVSMA